jgi:hypothetical protein
MTWKLIGFYIALLLPCFLIMAGIWGTFSHRLYYCSDRVPILDFIPPFVHLYPGIHTGDHYLVAPPIVWSLWTVFAATTLLVPALAIRYFWH